MDGIASTMFAVAALHLRALALLVFAYSGMLKWIGSPVDTTVASALALVVVAIPDSLPALTRADSRQRTIVACLLLFLGYYLATGVYSLSPLYWANRAQSVVLDALALVCSFVLLNSEPRVVAFLRMVIVVGLLTALAVVYFGLTGDLERVLQASAEQDRRFPDYLRLGLVVGGALVVSLFTDGKSRYFVALICALALGFLGGRGPALAVIIVIVIALLVSLRRCMQFGWVILMSAVLAMMSYAYSAVTQWTSLSVDASRLYMRLMASSEHSDFISSDVRTDIFAQAISVWLDYLWFGTGIGGYGVAAYGSDEEANPHNIVLEAAAETGVIGLVVFLPGLAMLLSAAIGCLRRTLWTAAVGALFIFMMIHYMKSGGFVSARDLYMAGGAVVATYGMHFNRISCDRGALNRSR